MNGADMLSLLPIMILSASSLLVMLAVAFHRHYELTVGLTGAGLVLAWASLAAAHRAVPRLVTPLLTMDRQALFYQGLIIAAGLAVTLLAYNYFRRRAGRREELYILLLLATLGAAVLAASSHFISFFLGLELLSVTLFALVAYPAGSDRALEAGTKYLLLAGVSSALLLFGMALIYARSGTMEFVRIGEHIGMADDPDNIYLLGGFALMVAGISFKLSLAPFHLWAPDIYEGAPAPVAAFVATVSKGAVFALLLRFINDSGGDSYRSLMAVLAALSIASMLAGNLLALRQNNIKRILAYSSIAHMGYALVALMGSGALAQEAVGYYLVAYFVTMLGAFGVVGVLSHSDRETDCSDIEEYRGLGWRRPWLAGIFTGMLLSLAGIPLTVGFVAKFYVLAAGVDAALWLPVAVLIAGSVIGLFYYLRIILIMYGRTSDQVPILEPAVSRMDSLILAALAFLLLGLGIYPSPLIGWIQGG